MFNTTPPAFLQIEEVGPQDGLVPAWSFSVWDKHHTCPYSVYLSRVAKHRYPDSEAAARGQELHDAAEHFVDGQEETLNPILAKHFEQRFHDLRMQYEEGKVSLEGDWGFDVNWEPTGWMDDNVWARIKLDAFVLESDTSGRVIDYKSGRQYPVKHNLQGQLYTVAGFIKYPKLQYIESEFWYVDQSANNIARNSYTRDQAMYFLDTWTQRGLSVTKAKRFPASPSQRNCKWCDHNKHKTCEYRVE